MFRMLCARVTALAFTVALITSCGGNPPPGRTPSGETYKQSVASGQPVRVAAIPSNAPPQIVGESAIVVDVVSGRVLYAKNADLPRAVASTQKIITALCVLDAGNLDRIVTIAPRMATASPPSSASNPGPPTSAGICSKS